MKNNTKVEDYFSESSYNLYKTRVIVYTIFLVLVLLLGTLLSFNLVKKIEINPINYTDSGTVDYRVYLKENEFYTEEFLPKGKSYVTSLIDYIDINYNYIFNIEDLPYINFYYKIKADLVIENNSTNKELLTTTYDLSEEKTKKLEGINELLINEKFQIEYEKYNAFANDYRSKYGVDTNSYLKVYLEVRRNTINQEDYEIDNTIKIDEISIPLSEKAIEINIDSSNNQTTNQVTFKEQDNINYVNVIIILLLIPLLIYIIRVIVISYGKMSRRRTIYDKYIDKLIREYDRLIIITKTLIDFRKYNIIKVAEFGELLDVRDNLKLPINYYCYIKHLKGIFYVKSDDDIYALFVNGETLEIDNNTTNN